MIRAINSRVHMSHRSYFMLHIALHVINMQHDLRLLHTHTHTLLKCYGKVIPLSGWQEAGKNYSMHFCKFKRTRMSTYVYVICILAYGRSYITLDPCARASMMFVFIICKRDYCSQSSNKSLVLLLLLSVFVLCRVL